MKHSKRHVYVKGEKIHRVTFVSNDGRTRGKSNFICFCGTPFKARIYNVEHKTTQSCGCLRREASRQRSTVPIGLRIIEALELDFAANNMTIKAMAEKHGLNKSRVNSLRKKYYERNQEKGDR